MIPFSGHFISSSHSTILNLVKDTSLASHTTADFEAITGTLDPIDIEHIGTVAGASEYLEGRTDFESSPSSEAWLPIGVPGNSYSAMCDGGYFLVGPGGSADFGSPAGTISLWLKWHDTAPHGRFWGQHFDFETRWVSNRLTLDWGTDTTFQGTKNDWLVEQWYFIAIAWNETSDFIALYWGDETHEPVEDAFTDTWTGTVTGLHTENDIMNSAARPTAQVRGHVDDFRYYSVSRNLEQLTSDYNISLSGSEQGLTNYYQFEDDLEDSSGTENLVGVGISSFSHDVYTGEKKWRAEQIEVNVRNLRNLHVLNGTFESGIPGVNVDWNGDGQYYPHGWSTQRRILSTFGRQRSSYVDTDRKYVTLENEGYATGDPIEYRHYNGTSIFWSQTVFNNESTESFQFEMSYLYQRGPIGQNYSGIFEFTFEILNGSSVIWNWSIDPTNITQRSVWYTVGPLQVDIPEAPALFETRLSLKVASIGNYVAIPEDDGDLDGDSANGQFVTFMIDDIDLVGSHNPDLESVSLEVSLPFLGTQPLVGEYGVGSIFTDHNYWESATIPVSFSSNSSVSFEYSVRVSRMTRLCYSSSTTTLEQPGVAYTIDSGERAELELFTYMEPYPEVEDTGFRVYFHYGWDNPAVENPFSSDVTDDIIINSHYIELPTGLVDSSGWWRISFDSPNYIPEMTTQILNESEMVWEDASVLHPSDIFRCHVVMGTDSELLSSVDNLLISWFTPAGSMLTQEIISIQNDTLIVSSSFSLSPANSSPGVWSVSAIWSNGSAAGVRIDTFQVHHELNIISETPNVQLELGEVFTAAVYVYDQDNGNQIFDGVSVFGNWSTQNVDFSPNMARGWFEADFNTSIIGHGDFIIVINVIAPYYDSNHVTIDLNVPSSEPIYGPLIRAGILGAVAFALLVGGVFVTRRFYTSITNTWNLELLGLTRRIEDAKNLIGVLVIHRDVGLPVYSKILRGSFQEAVLSSFISAISQFRTEFSMDEPKWTAIPITEAITALQTEAFICAIITVDQASDSQRDQLESFGLEVGGFYDHDDEATKQVLHTPKRIALMSEQFDPIFDKHFDGALMKRYVGVKKDLPKSLKPVSDGMKAIDIDHGVSPGAIIKSVMLLGFNERRSHSIVLEAIDNGYLIEAEKRLPSPITTSEE
jgi:hypothetical protein